MNACRFYTDSTHCVLGAPLSTPRSPRRSPTPHRETGEGGRGGGEEEEEEEEEEGEKGSKEII